uniref:Uncharacterized protein LOC100186284 n=1 Tax=Phallusia mammillata TaxID=59560 RepID=A0A6F9DJ56_9ASCI|nr:uncharacterized protein LOC100186284 [Phallusia mammillata]
MVKVICAGAPKTGTKSLARALRILGYNEVYDYEEGLEFAFDEWEEILHNRSTDVNAVLEKVYSKDCEAVVDLPHSHFFEFFLKRWPDAKVILMTRDETSWFTSFADMLNLAKNQHWMLNLLVYFVPASRRIRVYHEKLFSTVLGSEAPNELKWKMWYRRHNCYVKETVPPNQLLVFNISEGWDPLCAYLDKDIPDEPFPFENKAGSKTSIVERVIEDTAIVKRIKLEATIILSVAPILFLVLIYYFFF